MKYEITAFQVSPSSTDLHAVPGVTAERYGSGLPRMNVDSRRSYKKPFLDRAMEDSARAFFDAKASEWIAATHWQSSVSAMTAHPAFAEIKGLGDRAIRFVLQRMERGSVHLQWFPLLHDLAGVDPVPPEERGFVPKMTVAWLQWGHQTGRI